MKKSYRLLTLPLLPAFLASVSCGPSSTGVDEQDVVPVAETADGDYRISTMTVADDDEDALDITGDGREDNNLEYALDELAKFLTEEIEAVLADVLSEEQAYQISLIITPLIQSAISVDTISAALQAQVELEPWITRDYAPDTSTSATTDYNAIVDYWIGYQEAGDESYYLVSGYEMGELPEGNYDSDSSIVDSWGGPVHMKMNVIFSTGSYTYSVIFEYDLEECRAKHYFDEDALEDAKLAGKISTTAIEQLVTYLFDYIANYIPQIPEESLDAIEEDVAELLEDVADVTLENGEAAISASFLYNADAIETTEYY